MEERVLKPFTRYNPRVWKPWMEVALMHYLADRSHAEIAQTCGKGEQSIKQFVRSTIFQQRVQELLDASRQRMLKGEAGPVAIAEAAAEEAMQTLVDLMRTSESDAVRRQCAVDLLAHAGLQPAARTEVRVTIEHLVEQMTAEELRDFAEHQRWPARLEGEARRLLAAPKR